MRTWQRLTFAMLALTLVIGVLALPAPSTPVLADDNVRIDAPADGASISGRVEVRGRATTADPGQFAFYRLHYGGGDSPSVFRPIGGPGDKAVVDDVLGVWDTTPLFPGQYTLQLTVYDQAGNTIMAHVLVNVLPAPTPTPRTDQPPRVVVPGATPEQTDDNGPTPTPIPELPQLVPNIPQIDVPQPNQGPAVSGSPQQTNPDVQPVTIPGSNPLPPPSAPAPAAPQAPVPAAAPTVDLGPSSAPPPQNINPVAPPPPPVIAPFEPAPPPPTIAPPTPEGLPL